MQTVMGTTSAPMQTVIGTTSAPSWDIIKTERGSNKVYGQGVEMGSISNEQVLSLFLVLLSKTAQDIPPFVNDNLVTELNNLFNQCYENKTNYIEKAVKLINEKEILDSLETNLSKNKETFGNNTMRLNKELFVCLLISPDSPEKWTYLAENLYNTNPEYLNTAKEIIFSDTNTIQLDKILFTTATESATSTSSTPAPSTPAPTTTTQTKEKSDKTFMIIIILIIIIGAIVYFTRK
jgi:hypothetical protein